LPLFMAVRRAEIIGTRKSSGRIPVHGQGNATSGEESPSGNLPARNQIRRWKLKLAPGVAHRSSRRKTDPGRAERERSSEQERFDALSGSRRPTGKARPGGVLPGLRTTKS
jgi:hypothetical protein